MTHLPGPLVYTAGTQGIAQFAPGSSADIPGSNVKVCPAFSSIVTLEAGSSTIPASVLFSTLSVYTPIVAGQPINVYCALWGGGGGGASGPTDNPAGDLIGGGGGSGECVVVNFTLNAGIANGFDTLVQGAGIQVVAGSTSASVNFIDTRFVPPKIKSITAVAGGSGTPAVYSVGSHAAGSGGAGGGTTLVGSQVSIAAGDVTAAANFLNIGPDGSTGQGAWAFSALVNNGLPVGITNFTITNVPAPSGAAGAAGGILQTNSVMYDPATRQTSVSAAGAAGFTAGYGGAGCGSSRYVTPSAGGLPRAIVRVSRP
jgi:hypothetical protein